MRKPCQTRKACQCRVKGQRPQSSHGPTVSLHHLCSPKGDHPSKHRQAVQVKVQPRVQGPAVLTPVLPRFVRMTLVALTPVLPRSVNMAFSDSRYMSLLTLMLVPPKSQAMMFVTHVTSFTPVPPRFVDVTLLIDISSYFDTTSTKVHGCGICGTSPLTLILWHLWYMWLLSLTLGPRRFVDVWFVVHVSSYTGTRPTEVCGCVIPPCWTKVTRSPAKKAGLQFWTQHSLNIHSLIFDKQVSSGNQPWCTKEITRSIH